jgi:Phosphodiester glycosidase
MKRIAQAAVYFLLLALWGQPSVSQNLIPADKVYHDGPNEISVYDDFGITIISVHHGFDFLFVPDNVEALDSVARSHHYRFVINGSFFDGSALHAGHSGWLRIYGKTYSPLRPDVQLTHIVRFDSTSMITAFINMYGFKPGNDNHSIEFQTGPLIIDSNKVAISLIQHSINGSGKYKRTLMAVTDNRGLFLITVRNRVSLDSLANYLLSLSLFASHRLDVMNLDGGSSVALFTQNHPELNYNESSHLPMLIGVK